MINSIYKIAENLLYATNCKFHGNYLNIPEIKIYWHNIVFLFISEINGRRLFRNSNNIFLDMTNAKLMPKFLYDFYIANKDILYDCIKAAVEEFDMAQIGVNVCRQELLNIEIDFTHTPLKLFNDKNSRDNTGSYYTPENLAIVVIKKAFSGYSFKKNGTYRIADFSCGCGDFFLAIMTYIKDKYDIEYQDMVEWFYGVDIDPIALQICIVNLIEHTEKDKWANIISHFHFGNSLLICEDIVSEEEKNKLFATQRLYSTRLGLSSSFFSDEFDAVVGNPPWEKIRFEERKFFKGISNSISEFPQKNMRDLEVRKLKDNWPVVYSWRNEVFLEYEAMTAAKYSHCKIIDSIAGELNTYSMFTELGYRMLSETGVLAMVIKSTLVTAPVHQKLWTKLLSEKAVKAVYLFENRDKIFNIDSREQFIVFIASKVRTGNFLFSTGLTNPDTLENCDSIMLTAKDLQSINPFTNTIPNVRRNNEISFLKNAHNCFRLFSDIYPNCHFGRLIHLTAHADFIDKQESAENIPIYEGKFIEQYDGRYATFRDMPEYKKYANKATATKIMIDKNGKKELPKCRYFVHKEFWEKYKTQYKEDYLLCWRSLTSPTNRRTMLAMILPTCPTCQSIQMLQIPDKEELVMLLALFNSIPFDYFVRIKMPGLDLTQSVIKQIPVPSNIDYQKKIVVNGIEATLKKHILSYTISILKEEERLNTLIDYFKNKVYKIDGMSTVEKKKMIDFFLKEAYHLDDVSYNNILLTFPKYQADHTV